MRPAMEQTERILDKLDSIDERLSRQGESLARLEERFASPNNPTSYEVMNEQHKVLYG
jgi:hypothetical protein